jgi:serine/threonine protein kinase/tetratricopeptide (TPR) repeat protein
MVFFSTARSENVAWMGEASRERRAMPSDPKRVQAIFLSVVEQPDPAARAAVLDRECAGDADLRGRVEALLKANDDPASFLDKPAVDAAPDGTGAFAPGPDDSAPPGPAAEAPGQWIGPYRLLQEIGAGGMGTVWMAEQEHPVRRRVALKVIKPGMDSAQVIARFEAERQALALMDHQNIAKVLDAGTAPHGRPYFVMELIKGVPITKFCDEHHLTPRERLELFVPVCQAVQHAHQKGVIHRDLKPSNVLVTLYDGRPVPKVIDFGVAKALHQRLTDRTLFTDFGAVVGTLEYMAPEQAALSHLDVDTRSDVYSLGVLLYELLTGTTPFERKRLRQAALDEVLRIIREEEPPKPSTRLSESGDALPSIAALRKTEPAKLSRLVRGELDWIVMRALEKDRSRRYETANGFARDIQRYLADEPVEACPPSATYRLRKFARKHRRLLATAAAFVLLLAVAAVVSAGLAVWALRAERAAVTARDDEANQRADAERQRNDAHTARALADRNFQKARAAVENYLQKVEDNQDLKNNPNSYELRKQLLAAALPFFEEFVEQKSDDPAVRFDQAEAYCKLAKVRRWMGENETAIREYTTARDLFAKLAADFPTVADYRDGWARSLTGLGYALQSLGKRPEAEVAYRRSINLHEQLAADFPNAPDYRWNLANSQVALGFLLQNLGKRIEAEAVYRQAITITAKLVTDFPAVPIYRSDLANSHFSLGILLDRLGKRPEAEAEYRAALAVQEKLVADFPATPDYRREVAATHNNLGTLLRVPGQKETEYRAALTLFKKLVADFPSVPLYRRDLANSHINLGTVLRDPGQREAEYRAGIDIRKALVADFPSVPQYHSDLAISHNNLGALLSDLGRRPEAEAEYRAALAQDEKLAADFPDESKYRYELATGHNLLAKLLRDLGKQPEAEAEYRAALVAANEVAAAPNLSAIQFYNLACVSALAAANLPQAESDHAAACSVELLRHAVLRGFRDIAHLLKDSDLDALRRRADYADLLWDLADLPPGRQPDS